jgi:putative ABC transport system permease protein
VALLIWAGLLIRSLQAVEGAALGFSPERVLAMHVSTAEYSGVGAKPALYRRIVDNVSAEPGVEGAALVSEVLISGDNDQVVTVEGAPPQTVRTRFRADEASDGFFEVVGAKMLRGRGFDRTDTPTSERVVVINESLERLLWPNAGGVGRRFKFGPEGSAAPWLTVVGVVGDMRHRGHEAAVVPQMFASLAQNPSRLVVLVVKTTSNTFGHDTVVRLKAAVRRADPALPIYGTETLENLLALTGHARRFQTGLVGLFAAVAALLAAVGVFSLVHHGVTTRTREIAIRRAVGAGPVLIYRLILGEAIAVGLLGLAGGFVLALGIGHVATGFLVGVTETDPATFGAVAAVVVGCCLAAGYLPARRANRIEPSTELR